MTNNTGGGVQSAQLIPSRLDLRDYRYDNIKAILLFCVVLGHAIERLYPHYLESTLLSWVYFVIYSFHMPVFTFISGVFTKEYSGEDSYTTKIIDKCLIPFISFDLFYWCAFSRSLGGILYPQPAMWYLLAVLVWRLFNKLFSRIRCSLLVSIIIALLIGLTNADNLLGLSKCICFFPYFLFGNLYANRERIKHYFHNKWTVVFSGMLCIILVVAMKTKGATAAVFYMSSSYTNIGLSTVEGIIERALGYAIGLCSIVFLVNLSPNKKLKISTVGLFSLPVYLLHIGIIRVLEYLGFIIVSDGLFLAMATTGSIILVFCCGNKAVNNVLDRIFRLIHEWMGTSPM